MDESASLAQKQDYLARAWGRWTNSLEPLTGPRAAERLGYRDRVTLTARWSGTAGWRFGLMRRDELIAIHYDSRDNLLAMGVIPRPRSMPNPFPATAGFVPDPPRP